MNKKSRKSGIIRKILLICITILMAASVFLPYLMEVLK
ncbi:hypothetical protein ATF84_11310 [[Clostridium] innocuum]|nr:hypothetical protein ATF84_11310 [[Clostridium] innocuum]SSA47126.1 hypothetical protein SAMN04487929_11310 [[Clostridium] innocuum]